MYLFFEYFFTEWPMQLAERARACRKKIMYYINDERWLAGLYAGVLQPKFLFLLHAQKTALANHPIEIYHPAVT
jgi:hypothetical protein